MSVVLIYMGEIKIEKSRELFERAKKVQAGWMGSTGRMRTTINGVQIYMERGKGSKIIDVDGNELIDYFLNFGALINGHANSSINSAIQEQIEKGTMYGLGNELEIKLSEKLIKHIPCAELVNFHNSGSEAVHSALRLARAYTGKDKIIKFEGHYHGWHDSVDISAFSPPRGSNERPEPVFGSPAGQPKSVLQDIIILPWNNPEILENTIKEHIDELACVIMEPIELAHGIMPKEGYLETVREMTEKYGVLLIFDEVKTMFRLGLGGAQEYLGVEPDLFTCSKSMGGGLPISAFGGKKEVMELVSQGKVPVKGTYNANSISLGGALANLKELEKGDGKAYDNMYKIGKKLMDGIRDIFENLGVKGVVMGLPPQFITGLTELSAEEITDYRTYTKAMGLPPQFITGLTELSAEQTRDYWAFYRIYNKVAASDKAEKYRLELFKNGMFIYYPVWDLSIVHDNEDVNKTLKAVEMSLKGSGLGK